MSQWHNLLLIHTDPSFEDNEGNYKYSDGDTYPLGTYPVSPNALGQEFGWNSVHRPSLIEAEMPELELRQDFQWGVISGIRQALNTNTDMGEERI